MHVIEIDGQGLFVGDLPNYQREVETEAWAETLEDETVIEHPTVYKQVVIVPAVLDPETEEITTPAVMADYPLNIIPVRAPQGFHIMRWNGSNPWVEGEDESLWVEGKPQAEIDAVVAEDLRRVAVTNLAITDSLIARIGEDLIQLLIAKGIFMLSELPIDAQNTLTTRVELRAQLL